MPEIQRLNEQERLFLTFTPPGVRWYAIGAGVCDPPNEARRPTVGALVDSVRSRMHLASPRFRQRIKPTPLGLAPPAWVDDAAFDVANHVSAALPEGTSMETFQRFVAELAMAPMDIDRPLWDVHLVERLDGGHAGFVIRAHHSMADGGHLLAFLTRVLIDLTPEPAPPGPIPPWTAQPAPTDRELVVDGLSHLRRRIGATARHGLRRVGGGPGWRGSAAAATGTLRAVAGEFAPIRPLDLVRGPSSAQALLGRAAVGSRAISVHHVELPAMRAVARAQGATINDLAAAVVADAMRRLLRARGLPLRPLKILCPVNLGVDGSEEEHVGFMLMPLPLGDEPPDCLRKISAHSRRERETHQAARVDGLLVDVAHASHHAYLLAQHILQSPRSAALALSNVRGPDHPLWLCGAPVTELYPVLPLGPHHDLAVGLLSYQQTVALCVIRDPTVAPELDDFARCLDAAIAAIESHCEDPAPRE